MRGRHDRTPVEVVAIAAGIALVGMFVCNSRKDRTVFVKLISGFVAFGAVGFAFLAAFAAGMSDSMSNNRPDPIILWGCGIVSVVGVCGVIWGH